DETLGPHLDLGPVLRVEQHAVADLDGAHLGTDRLDPRPSESAADRRDRRDDDAATGAPITGFLVQLDQESVVQHPDRKFGVHHFSRRRRTTSPAIVATVPVTIGTMCSYRRPVSSSTKYALICWIWRAAMLAGLTRSTNSSTLSLKR